MSRLSPGILLSTANYGGTLAATRCLGERGVQVVMADPNWRGPAAWSRYVARRVRTAPARPVQGFIDWLVAFGRREPGYVLYATNDDLAWAFAEHEARLKEHFLLLTPPFSTIAKLLDKRDLYAACADAGIETPWTRFPADAEELEAVARDGRFPAIVKPRTQVLFSLRKGLIARSGAELRTGYAQFLEGERYQAEILNQRPDIERPMVQEFCGAEPMYCISGFCDYRHDLFVVRAARKLVQWPREAGLGIGFEDATVDLELAARVRRLCASTGFFGVFEAEFVTRAGTPLLVDFNPRLFGQMGFDTARELPSAYLVYLDAVGDIAHLREEVEAAARWRPPGRMLFVDKTALFVTSLAERIVGRSPPSLEAAPEHRRATNGAAVVREFTFDRRDPLPGIIDRTVQIERSLRHAFKVLRTAARGS